MDHALPDSFRWLDDGSLQLSPRDPSFFANPYPAYAEMRRCDAPFLWRDLGALAFARHADVSGLLRDRRFGRILPADSEGRPDYAGVPAHLSDFYALERHSLLDLEPPTHSRIRSLVLKAFVSRKVEQLGHQIETLANVLIDRFVERGSVELVTEFAEPLPVTVIANLIGIDAKDATLLLDWSHRMVAMYQFDRTRTVEDAANRASAEFRAFVLDAIAHRRRRPADDLLSSLIRAETVDGKLSEDEMVATVVLLMNAGHEATVHQIGNGVKAILASYPSDPAALFAEETAGARASEETLRFDTPLHLFTRVALGDLTLADGTSLERGQEIGLLLGAANHDPSAYPEPERFDPHRTGPQVTSFGAGIHFCVGAPLARLELSIAYAALFRRLRRLRIAEPPRYRDSWHFRGLERLDLAFEPAVVKAG